MRQVVRGIGADEWFAVLALFCTAGVTADIIVGMKYGFGRHLTAKTTGAEIVQNLKVCSVHSPHRCKLLMH